MANFQYRVITTDGKEKSGVVVADDKNKALAQLRSEGNTVLEVKKGSALDMQINIGHKKKVKSRDLGVFCRQFNSLLTAGVSIVTALEMLGEQTENPTLKAAVMNVRDGIQKGDNLAGAMKKETCFPPILISMMDAGEASGNLEKSLERMSEHFDKDAKVKGMVKKAMIYPVILMIVAIAVLVIMVVAVIPNFASMFADMDTKLPAITQGLMNLSHFLRKYWYIAVAIVVGIVVGIKTFKKTDTGAHFFAKLAIKMPIFGNLTVKTASARFARTFGTMLASGMSMVEAMEITAKTMDNIYFREALEEATEQIQRGVAINQPLKKSGLFPPLIIHMVGIGEETGNLETMLNNCAVYYDEEVELATQSLMAMMEPMIIIVLAGIVCVILAAIYGPMITMYNALGDM